MGWWEALLILVAAAGAGAVNVVLGGGSLITYPTLLALGLPPLLANVANTIGLIAGNAAGLLAYRPLLQAQGPLLLRLLPFSLLGGLSGAILLLTLPAEVFAAVVPLLIALASLLMAIQPPLKRWIERRSGSQPPAAWPLPLGLYLAGVYGGYFGAAQGVMLMAILALGLQGSLQRLNGIKNLLALAVNATAALYLIWFSPVNWPVAGLLAVGSGLGGWLAGRLGQRIPDRILRSAIVVGGLLLATLLAINLR
jgi:uncharacterized membrane protein YfcA